jgi:hypothetical protein
MIMTTSPKLRWSAFVGSLVTALFMGCDDQSSGPSPSLLVEVDYYRGFAGDSVVVSLDGRVMISGLAYSFGSGGRHNGVIMHTIAGRHRLKLEIPLEMVSADTMIWVVPDYQPSVYAYFDTSQHNIRYEIYPFPGGPP